MNNQVTNQHSASKIRKNYDDKGFYLARNLFDSQDFAQFERGFLKTVKQLSGYNFPTMHAPALRDYFDENRQIESEVYNAIRTTSEIRQLASDIRIAKKLNELFSDHTFGLFEKMILRIDLPDWKHEVAHWHQDHFYVKGNVHIVTTWIPLQPVNHVNGCLLVEQGSHKLGIVEHSNLMGKRHIPNPEMIASFNPFEVEMNLGDVLFFHTLLFHSGQLNQSDATRYSFQFRYSPIGLATDPGMGSLLPLTQNLE